ncbi:MAG: hypothetical protein PHF99_04300, partial [Bacteroidales bacterium]|nr:hypothetical protein [Bacteroidales bacterium]
MSTRAITLFLVLAFVFTGVLKAQITAPNASASFPTEYSSGFISSGGQNDLVYVFCGNQEESNIGELQVNAPGCTVNWYKFDGLSFSPIGQTSQVITNLDSGCYMAQVTCGGTTTCYRAWVWVNQTFVEIDDIPAGCETFTLSGSYEALDNTFTIVDPPSSNFVIDENTYIKVCFWATHTYVSDIGFYLKAPGQQLTEPGDDGVVQLCPSASDWGPNAAQGSWTGIPWSTLGCSDPSDENTVCNSGDNVSNFCFATHVAPGGPELPAGNPTYTPCVCDMPTPLSGTYASVGPWSTIYGANASDPGWSVQIYDCEYIDYGTLTQATITFIGDTDCGEALFTYNSGSISSAINDNSCDATSASLYVVPPGEPAGQYEVTSSIDDDNILWTCDALPGWDTTANPVTIVSGTENFPQQSTQYVLTVYETIDVQGNPTCAASATEYFETLPADATIDAVDPLCYNAPPYQLTAEDGGGVWTSTTPNAIDGDLFIPGNVTPGDHEVTYTIDGPCSDQDNITITVYDIINITPPITECNSTNTAYTVSFDVTGSQGNPAEFYAVWNDGSGTFTGTFNQEFDNETIYNITVSDVHNCSEHVLNGFYACDCETYAGTMVNLQPLHLCDGECTGNNLHNGNHIFDGDDILEFIIHNGQYPPTIYAVKPTTDFCQNDIPGGADFETTYYISAIAGNEVGGHVDHTEICYSQSIGKPIVWHTTPTATIFTDEANKCGLTYCLEANEPSGSITGSWTADHSFVPTGGGSTSDNEMCVMVNDFNDVTFTWTLSNGYCSGTDDVTIHFLGTPNAYAGTNQTVCGYCTNLEAVYSMSGTTGVWSGAGGTFSSSTDPNAEVCVNQFGTYVFKWRENNAECYDEDNVTVTFLQEPQPNISLQTDTVCGVTYNLHVDNVIGQGQWRAYNNGVQVFPSFVGGTSDTDPSATVVVSAYENHADTIIFEWEEIKQHEGIQCFGSASIEVVFVEEPSANVGTDNQGQACGNQFTFSADTTGTGWANGFWAGKDILPVSPEAELFDDETDPFATVTIDSLASYGDSAYVEVTFIWFMMNTTNCIDMDTMYVTFYQHPNANAGLDQEVCGLMTELEAFWSIPATESYEPSGWWTTHSGPNTNSVNIHYQDSAQTLVTVGEPGTYEFVWRESNSNRPSCYSTDTVKITFIEIPVI